MTTQWEGFRADLGAAAGLLSRLSAEARSLAPPELEISSSYIRSIIRARRRRGRYFDSKLFADPAWDILLDVMAARLEGEPVSVSSLCGAAAVPPTTALRWIAKLTTEGYLEREEDPHDGRRVFIRITDSAAAAMMAFLAAEAVVGAP